MISNPGLLAAAVLTVVLLVAFAATLGLLVYRQRGPASGRRGWPDISPNKYVPLNRLLADSDFEFVRNHGGGSEKMTRRLRRSRCSIVSEYLREIESDFNDLYGAASEMLCFAPAEHSGLALDLARLRWGFLRNLFHARLSLAMSRVGWNGFDAKRLLMSIRQMQDHLVRLTDWAAERAVQ